MKSTYHDLSIDETAKKLNTDTENGLTDKAAKRLWLENGPNALPEGKRKSLIRRFIEQFNDFMIIVLLAAAAVSFFTSFMDGNGDIAEPVIILAIVVFNALLGILQESRAEKSLENLKKLSSPHALVLRDGEEKDIPAEEVVKGDILILNTGNIACADCRLISSNNLTADESSLTGESVPVSKEADIVCDKNASMGDRYNMIYSSSSIISGNGRGIVVDTGADTEVGQIASMLIGRESVRTPLQKKLSDTGKALGMAALLICAVIFVIGIVKKLPPLEMFMTAVSLAVAAIPEGLPAIVTIMLAMGLMRMSKKNAIVRHLPSVETLGSASVICSDKTGTLTQNRMRVTKMYSSDEKLLLTLGAMCSKNTAAGFINPTDSAVINCAAERGIDKEELDKKYPMIDEIPFDSSRKRMTTAHKHLSSKRIVVKGALEYVLPLCKSCVKEHSIEPLTVRDKTKIMRENEKMTSQALRVIAVAYRDTQTAEKKLSEGQLIFAGLIGIEDPPRTEAIRAVAECKKAGIRPVMITGDHAATALSIAKQTGIADSKDKVITGAELDKIDDDELKKRISDYSVFARVTPSHKVRIVEAWQKNGQIVAMTGDGVNDAPALSKADIGCSMGKTGTDVAKSASDMILTDDNFATIVYAVREGRAIFANIKKAVHFLLSSNIGEILAVFGGLVFGWTSPLTATQLLWVNLVTDSLPAIALGLDEAEKDIMEKPPRPARKSLFADGLWASIIFEGLLIGALALLAFSTGANVFGDINIGRTMAFATLSLSELVHSFNMRSERSAVRAGLLKNPYLVLSFAAGAALEIAVITIPAAASIFGASALNTAQWLCVGVLSLMPLIIVEAQKAVIVIFSKK